MSGIRVEFSEKTNGKIAYLILDRADKANALSSNMISDIEAAVKTILAEDELRCVVIKGTTDKVFCAGSDLKELSELTSGSAGGFLRSTHTALKNVRNIPVPVIAQIEGPCMGVGMELAAVCDIRIASTSASFAMPKVKIGIPSVIEAALVARIIGQGRASFLMLSGNTVSAQQVYDWGFLEQVADDSNALTAAVDNVIDGILSAGFLAVCAQKRLLQSWQEKPLAECIEESIRPFAAAHASNEPGELSARVIGRLKKNK
ncbi:MAG: hypothetical protein HON65_09700 [Rhodospirillales bacterium]|nr:hypothetical protein [Rhodospirillales bacterium]